MIRITLIVMLVAFALVSAACEKDIHEARGTGHEAIAAAR